MPKDTGFEIIYYGRMEGSGDFQKKCREKPHPAALLPE